MIKVGDDGTSFELSGKEREAFFKLWGKPYGGGNKPINEATLFIGEGFARLIYPEGRMSNNQLLRGRTELANLEGEDFYLYLILLELRSKGDSPCEADLAARVGEAIRLGEVEFFEKLATWTKAMNAVLKYRRDRDGGEKGEWPHEEIAETIESLAVDLQRPPTVAEVIENFPPEKSRISESAIRKTLKRMGLGWLPKGKTGPK